MLKNMSLSKKLTLGFASLIVLLLIQIGIGINGMRTMDGNMERIVKVNAIRINHLGEMQTSITGIGTNVRNIIINDSIGKEARNTSSGSPSSVRSTPRALRSWKK